MKTPQHPDRNPATKAHACDTALKAAFGLLRSAAFWVLLAVAFLSQGSTAAAGDPDNCLFCHQYRGLSCYDASAHKLSLFFVKPEYVHERLGPHARVSCTGCHERSEVEVIPHKTVSKVDCTRVCHLRDADGQIQRFSHSNVEEMLGKSVHKPAVLAGIDQRKDRLLDQGQSACLYCHDEPLFRDAAGAIPMLAVLGGRTFDRCDVCHLHQIPSDIGYYLRHIAARLQPARPPLEIAQVCAVCHSDPELLKKGTMHDAVASYVRSYHGKAALLGESRTANCLSCHVAAGANVHLMLGKKEAASPVSPQRIQDTCRNQACHPGADKKLASASVHLNLPSFQGGLDFGGGSAVRADNGNAVRLSGWTLEFWFAVGFILLTVMTFGPSMTLCVLELFSLARGRHEEHDKEMEMLTLALLADPMGRRALTRFTVSQRVQHWGLAVLFILLAVTGFPMKFADRGWARTFIETLGGLDHTRLIHHWAGLALLAGLAGHTLYILWTVRSRMREPGPNGPPRTFVEVVTSLPMWIGPKDAMDMGRLLAHLIGLPVEKPTFGRFSVKEKFEYIGVFWGTIVLGTTGILLWGEQLSSHFISGRVLNLAWIAHTYEAFLAVIHVGILHIVNVMFSPNVFPLSRATLTGETPVGELVEAHSQQVLEVADALGVQRHGGAFHHA